MSRFAASSLVCISSRISRFLVSWASSISFSSWRSIVLSWMFWSKPCLTLSFWSCFLKSSLWITSSVSSGPKWDFVLTVFYSSLSILLVETRWSIYCFTIDWFSIYCNLLRCCSILKLSSSVWIWSKKSFFSTSRFCLRSFNWSWSRCLALDFVSFEFSW